MVTCGPSGSCVRCAAHKEPIREVAANPPVVAIAAQGCTLDASPPLLHRPHAVVLRVMSELGAVHLVFGSTGWCLELPWPRFASVTAGGLRLCRGFVLRLR